MPLPTPRSGDPKLYLRGYKPMSLTQMQAQSFAAPRTSFGRDFEDNEIAKLDNGGVDFNVNKLISMAVKYPVFAAEAPLRPLNALTGNAITNAASAVEGFVGKIPVISNILGGLGEGLRFLDNVAGALPNEKKAQLLRDLAGKPDSFLMSGVESDRRWYSLYPTAGDFRRHILAEWGQDREGNQYTLAQLEARAKNNTFDFGQFQAGGENSDAILRLLYNPLNLLFTPAGGAVVKGITMGARLATDATRLAAGSRYLRGASQAAGWARPLVRPGAPIGDAMQYGFGYARDMGRGILTRGKAAGEFAGKAMSEAHNPNRLATEFLDVNSAARALLEAEEGVRTHGTLRSVLTAIGWDTRGAQILRTAGRKVYFPGLDTNLQGARLTGAAARAWMRGGLQQELATGAGEFLFGNVDSYLQENNMESTIFGGITGAVHDGLIELNNNHPLSESNAFVMAALLMPWSKAGREVIAAPGQYRRARRADRYVEDTLTNLRMKLNSRMGGGFAKNDDLLEAIGKKTSKKEGALSREKYIARGTARFEYWVDRIEVIKAKNQFSHLFQQVGSAEIDGLAALTAFFGENVKNNILRRRKTGALQPGSTADYMLEKHFEAGAVPKGATELASEITRTTDSFIGEIGRFHEAYSQMGPQLEALGLDIIRGGKLTHEIREAIIAEIELTAEGQISRELASQVLAMAESLVYEGEFWRQFSVSLGQEAHGGKFGKAATVAENVTKADLIARLRELELPSAQEMFHETIRASKAQGVAKKDVFRIKESPYPLRENIKALRNKASARITQLSDNGRALDSMRNKEYFKSGKPKFGAAAEVVGPEGSVFKRVEVETAPFVDRTPPPWEGASMDRAVDDISAYITDMELSARDDALFDGALHLDTRSGFSASPDAVRDAVGEAFVSELRELRKSGYKGAPDSITINETLGGNVKAHWFAKDGLVGGEAEIIMLAGKAESINVVVLPKFQKKGVATRLYDELAAAGYDIRSISGRSTTVAGEGFTKAYWDARPPIVGRIMGLPPTRTSATYVSEQGVGVRVDKGVINILVPAEREAALLAELDKTIFRSGPRKGSIKPGMEAESQRLNLQIEATRLGIDTEALVLAAQNNGRIIVADRAAGPMLADYGFVESAVVRSSGLPPVADDMVRLYRGVGGVAKSVEGGNWFSASKAVAEDYAKIDSAKGYAKGTLRYVDVPKTEAAKYRTGVDTPEYAPGFEEYRVSPEIAARAKRVSGEQASYSYRGGDPSKIIANHEAKAFAPYRPSKREVSERGAIGVARRDAINASLFVDSTAFLGKSVNPSMTMFPEERLRFIKEHQAATARAYKQELEEISKMDEIAFDMLPFDKRIDAMNLGEWADGLSIKEFGKVRDFFADSFSQWPELSLVKREAGLVVDPSASRFSTLVTHRNRLRDIFIDYGPNSVIQRLYDAILAPVSTRWLGKQVQTEVHNLLATVGWEPAASRLFISKLRDRVIESREVKGLAGKTGSHTYRSIEALPEGVVRTIAREVAPDHAEAVLARWGDYQKMLTEASNRLLRTVQRKYRVGGKVNSMEAAADAAFRVWQHAPGLEYLSFSSKVLTKFVYPWFRFHSDPFFHVMNLTEPSIYAVMNNGWRGLRAPSEGAARRLETSGKGLIPPGGLYSDGALTELLLVDSGLYTLPRNIRPRLTREFELTTDIKATQLFEAMAKEHPVAQIMRSRFGDNIQDWAVEMNRLMENMARRGDDMVSAEWKAVLEDELGYTHAELKTIAPVAERLTEVYRGVQADLTDLYIGRMNRSNLERLSNTFFLAFPISYLIKATTWMYKILFEKLGPVPGSGGAYLWDQYRQKYEQELENNPEFARFVEENADFTFALEMMMPITPVNLGVRINKTTRYVGSSLGMEWLGNYNTEEFDAVKMVETGTRMGPIRTWNLAKRLLNSWEVPGFYHPKQGTYQPLPP